MLFVLSLNRRFAQHPVVRLATHDPEPNRYKSFARRFGTVLLCGPPAAAPMISPNIRPNRRAVSLWPRRPSPARTIRRSEYARITASTVEHADKLHVICAIARGVLIGSQRAFNGLHAATRFAASWPLAQRMLSALIFRIRSIDGLQI